MLLLAICLLNQTSLSIYNSTTKTKQKWAICTKKGQTLRNAFTTGEISKAKSCLVTPLSLSNVMQITQWKVSLASVT